MLFVAVAFIIILLAYLFAYAVHKILHIRTKQSKHDSYNEKVMIMNEASTLLKFSRHLRMNYNKLVEIYDNENDSNKKQKKEVILAIVNSTPTVSVAAAICALAKIESNRRMKKNVKKA
jgi:uncharacterized membrane protein YhiD involved in acid resistance